MRVRFWGVRGSVPAPLPVEEVATRLVDALWRYGQDADAPDLTDREAIAAWVEMLPESVRSYAGGNTPCVEMQTDAGDLFILDFGTGIRQLGNELMDGPFGRGKGHANLFLSHYHWDHLQGWPFFKPAYVEGNAFDLYARHPNPLERLRQQQEAPFFPPAAWEDMRATLRTHQLDTRPITLCDGRVKVSSLELSHPSRAYAYRFEADDKVFVYASDGAYLDLDDLSLRPFIDFYQDADLLIFDAQFTLSESFEKRTWGHSSAVFGVELACQANVRKLALFHHDPGADDSLLEAMLKVGMDYGANPNSSVRRKPNQVELFLAREGMTVEL
jgi:phosphoribosyl 1,2-cyclic phosphodiesterase